MECMKCFLIYKAFVKTQEGYFIFLDTIKCIIVSFCQAAQNEF